jgi:hypothetical protein
MRHRLDLLEPQRRALAAAAGVVGRPRLRAGLALTLAVACGPTPDEPGDEPAGSSGGPVGSSSSSSSAGPVDPTTGEPTPEPGSTGPAGADEAGSGTGAATSGDETTASTTLLTDATTTAGTDTDDAADTGSTGGLDDCIDPATMEVDFVCCEAQNWMPAPQCTPWGPPAPPAAGRRLLARARAARGRWA